MVCPDPEAGDADLDLDRPDLRGSVSRLIAPPPRVLRASFFSSFATRLSPGGIVAINTLGPPAAVEAAARLLNAAAHCNAPLPESERAGGSHAQSILFLEPGGAVNTGGGPARRSAGGGQRSGGSGRGRVAPTEAAGEGPVNTGGELARHNAGGGQRSGGSGRGRVAPTEAEMRAVLLASGGACGLVEDVGAWLAGWRARR